MAKIFSDFFTHKEIKDTALQFVTKLEFKTNHPKIYRFASTRKLLKKLAPHLIKCNLVGVDTKESLIKQARRYLTKNELRQENPRLFYKLRNRKIYAEATIHMVKSREFCRLEQKRVQWEEHRKLFQK